MFFFFFYIISCSLQDEGKRQALSAVKMEGAEVGQDSSLGKPFVFKCRPQSGIRVYFFCATSNQEMKRCSTDKNFITQIECNDELIIAYKLLTEMSCFFVSHDIKLNIFGFWMLVGQNKTSEKVTC